MDLAQAHSLDADEIFKDLEVDPEKGLDLQRVEMLSKQHGPNQINPEEPAPWWKKLVVQFMTPMIYLLAGAALISLAMGEELDAAAIGVVILINGGIGFVTEFRAEKALLALREMISPTAVVLREGVIRTINAASLVPGDIILLEAGDVIPADARVFEQYNLGVDESALTGESFPVDKSGERLPVETVLADRKNCLFSGTAVVRG